MPGSEPVRNDYSEATAQLIDREVQQLLRAEYQRALEILTKDRQVLVVIAERLLQKEVVDRDELRVLLGKPPQPESSHPEVGHVPQHSGD